MAMVLWHIYYDDGRSFTNLDGAWEEPPRDGVLCVVVRNEKTGRQIFQGSDFYFQIPGTDTLGYADDLGPFLRKLGLVKFGRWSSDKLMESTLIKAQNDADLPPKSAKDPFYDDRLRHTPASIKQG